MSLEQCILNSVFSPTRSASKQIYWNKRKRLHKKRVQFPQDQFGTQIWPPFHCFGTQVWPPWCHVKTHIRVSCFGGNSYRTTSPKFSIVPGVISHLTQISVFGQDEMLNPIYVVLLDDIKPQKKILFYLIRQGSHTCYLGIKS